MSGSRTRRGTEEGANDQSQLQKWITWGQTLTTESFAGGGVDATQDTQATQLCDVRYERPTSWTIVRSFQTKVLPAVGDVISVDWRVRIGLGEMNVEYQFIDVLTVGAPIVQVLLRVLTLPAMTIQIRAMNVEWASVVGSNGGPVLLAAGAAPVVD